MDTITKIYMIMITFLTIIMIIQLYTVIRQGKLIINAEKSRFSNICWVVGIIFWILMILFYCIIWYLNYRNNAYINILGNIMWIEIAIFNILRMLKSPGIRANGIYGSGNFYNWSKVQSYSWILPTTIQFEVNTFSKTNYSFEFTIEEKLISKVNETVQKYVL